MAEACARRHRAWDCGTGSAQAATGLAVHFDQVVATDISAAQLRSAVVPERVDRVAAAAEAVPLRDGCVDLVTVAQALHWFRFEPFFEEVRRVGRDDALLAIWAYGRVRVTPGVDRAIARLHGDILGDYWAPERRHVLDAYASVPVPFAPLEVEESVLERRWTLSELEGYIGTWSALRNYRTGQGRDPLELVAEDLRVAWAREVGGAPDARARVRWPLTLRRFRIGTPAG